MFLKLRLLASSLVSGLIIILVLCLGSQNINNRKSLNLGKSSIAALPTGFIIGLSVAVGVISGGSVRALMISKQDHLNKDD
tara:strand:- start:1303 stop:1545 length:243 start_codon:yes stop_codon:yes gene_type:complete